MKIRAPGAYGKFLRNLGASPVSLAWSEIYTSLATGVIDGSIGSNMIDHRDGNHVEVAKYMYPLPIAGAQVLPIVVNRRAWNKLPDDLKAIVKVPRRCMPSSRSPSLSCGNHRRLLKWKQKV